MRQEEEVYQKAYEKAIKLLKIRVHSTVEIARKLSLRGFNADIVQKVTSDLVLAGLLNDEQFAQTYLDSLVRFKTFGFYGLKAKLLQRGVPGSSAEALLKENFSLEMEKEIALKVLEKSSEKDKMKLAQKLSRKGFRSEVIRSLV